MCKDEHVLSQLVADVTAAMQLGRPQQAVGQSGGSGVVGVVLFGPIFGNLGMLSVLYICVPVGIVRELGANGMECFHEGDFAAVSPGLRYQCSSG